MNKHAIALTQLILKNWWKIILMIIALGVMVSGYVIQIGTVGCNKQQIQIWEKEKNNGR